MIRGLWSGAQLFPDCYFFSPQYQAINALGNTSNSWALDEAQLRGDFGIILDVWLES